jgi:hypothetical protein
VKRRRWGHAAVAVAIIGMCSCGPDGFHLGWGDGGTSNAPVCQGNACGDISITPETPGNTVNNKGTRTIIVTIRWTFGWSCLDPSNVTLGGGQSQTFENGGYCDPYQANYAGGGVPVPPPSPTPARISKFTITPSTIQAGDSTVFQVVLQNLAPAGGVTVVFSWITNTGLTDTILNMPVSLQIPAGVQQASTTVNTHRLTPDTTDIVFTAATAISKQSAELKIQ